MVGLFKALVFLLAGFGLVVLGAFAYYWALVPASAQTWPKEVDGIAVFTGGTNRIAAGAEFLHKGYEGPVLISGVYPGLTAVSLLERYEMTPDATLNVTVDYNALTTVGNVLETRRWAQKNHIKHILVVTSTYHMPRSKALLARYAPELKVTTYPVAPDHMNIEVLLQECIKFWGAILGFDQAKPLDVG